MAHRISAGALVTHEDKILLVHHLRPGIHDFWVAPGGGVEGGETLEQAAAREVLEETGLTVNIIRPAYIDELWNATDRGVKFWFLASLGGGSLNIAANPADNESIVGACWLLVITCRRARCSPIPCAAASGATCGWAFRPRSSCRCAGSPTRPCA